MIGQQPSKTDSSMPHRTVFFVSDGTGITAETFGNSILAQFSARPRRVRRPFIDTAEKARSVVEEINFTARAEGQRPVVFITMVREEVRQVLTDDGCQGMGCLTFLFSRVRAPARAGRRGCAA